MSENNSCFRIGDSPVDPNFESCLYFHQWTLYNNTWPSGTVKFDSVTKNFYIVPDIVEPPPI